MPWAVYTDLSGVAPIEDGLFDNELAAIQALILHLESDRTEVVDKIAKAKARRRKLNRRKR